MAAFGLTLRGSQTQRLDDLLYFDIAVARLERGSEGIGPFSSYGRRLTTEDMTFQIMLVNAAISFDCGCVATWALRVADLCKSNSLNSLGQRTSFVC